MAEISKISAVAIANVAKVDAVTKANIANINDLTIPSAAAFLLDTYTGAAAAYSVRRLNSLYTGACMRVRRSSDNTEQDIGFDSNGDLDTAALATFVGSGNDGFIRYWYDQSTSGGTGSGNDAGQATSGSQTQIYNGTAVITENGKPAIDIRSTQNLTFSATNLTTGFVVGRSDTANSNSENFMLTGTGRLGFNVTFAGSASLQIQGGDGNSVRFGTATDTAQKLAYVNHQSGTYYLAQDGASTVNVASTVGNVSLLGNRSGNIRTYFTLNGTVQEIVVWTTDESSDRSGIETNINNYFSVF